MDKFQQIDKTLYRGSQPDDDQLEQLKNQGIDIIINFRRMSEREKTVQNLNMDYIHLPVDYNKPLPDDRVKMFFEIIDKAKKENKKVFMHCFYGKDRTGIFAAIYKLQNGLADLDNCIKEMIDFGHTVEDGPHFIECLKNFANSLKESDINLIK